MKVIIAQVTTEQVTSVVAIIAARKVCRADRRLDHRTMRDLITVDRLTRDHIIAAPVIMVLSMTVLDMMGPSMMARRICRIVRRNWMKSLRSWIG